MVLRHGLVVSDQASLNGTPYMERTTASLTNSAMLHPADGRWVGRRVKLTILALVPLGHKPEILLHLKFPIIGEIEPKVPINATYVGPTDLQGPL